MESLCCKPELVGTKCGKAQDSTSGFEREEQLSQHSKWGSLGKRGILLENDRGGENGNPRWGGGHTSIAGWTGACTPWRQSVKTGTGWESGDEAAQITPVAPIDVFYWKLMALRG